MKRLLRTLILLAVRLLGARAAAKSTSKPITAAPRILLVRPDHLGDLLMTTPVLHALKQQRRPTLGNHAAMDLGKLEVWINLGFDGDDFVFSGE